MPVLIVFGGLPGAGKTTLARLVAQDRAMAYLRIDEIEQALRSSGCLAGDVGPAGYMAAYALAASNLRLGRPVLADCVNPVAATRDAWRHTAASASAILVEVEVVCSDPAEHRRRVEGRVLDIAGLVPPSWPQVMARDYEDWSGPRIVVDTAGRTATDSLQDLRIKLADVARV